MSFYTTLSGYYDLLFPLEEEILSFLTLHLEGAGRVVDLACGTGTYTLALAQRGKEITGIDNASEMIKLAEDKGPVNGLEFVTGDMLDYGSLGPGRYDGAYCIGNSVVHLQNSGEILQLFKLVSRILNTFGVFIVQIINFDRLQRGITELPSLDAAGIQFTRKYLEGPDGDHVFFSTDLIIGKGTDRQILRNKVPLLILKSDSLLDVARKAGFGEFKLYGSYSGKPHTAESFLTILVARKQSSTPGN